MNNKTRLTKIPWKIKKKGIDKKMDSKEIYEQYKLKIKNPFNQNIRKIMNVNRSIKSSFSNSIRSSLIETKKVNIENHRLQIILKKLNILLYLQKI